VVSNYKKSFYNKNKIIFIFDETFSFYMIVKYFNKYIYKLRKEIENEFEKKFVELKEKYEKKTSDLSDSESYLSGN